MLIDHFGFEIEDRMYKVTEKLIKCFIRLQRKWQLARSFSPWEEGQEERTPMFIAGRDAVSDLNKGENNTEMALYLM